MRISLIMFILSSLIVFIPSSLISHPSSCLFPQLSSLIPHQPFKTRTGSIMSARRKGATLPARATISADMMAVGKSQSGEMIVELNTV
jgi:hypothetical protein